MVAATIFTYTPVLRALSGGMRIIIVTVIVAGAAAYIWPVEN